MTERSETLFTFLEQAADITDVCIRYTEVEVPGGRVSHAVSQDGRRHLLVPLTDEDDRVEDQSSRGVTISIRQLVDEGVRTEYLDVACEMREMRDLFAEVCDEMLRRLNETPGSRPGPVCRGVLQRWRDLLAPTGADLLGRDRLAGLLAELHFLEEVAAQDCAHTLSVWTGPDNSGLDFTGPEAGVEVKATTSAGNLRVEIHGLEQLDPGDLGEIYLLVEQLRPEPSGGDSVPDAVSRLSAAGVEPADLLRKLRKVGYDHTDSDAYRRVRFRRIRQYTFRTTAPGFPKLTRDNLQGPPLPGRISRIRYVIDLSDTASVPGLIDDTRPAVLHLLEDLR